jgi:hypothetical protein
MTQGFELVFCLEEPSFKAMLEGLMPRLAPNVPYRCFVFQGKSDLQKGLQRKIQHYLNPLARFIIVQDQDNEDCRALKTKLKGICQQADRGDSLVRIVCRELESWYLADLNAVELGLPEMSGKLKRRQNAAKYRSPDTLVKPSRELETLTKYQYQKVGGSRAIGPYLDLSNQRSSSFHAFVTGITRLLPPAEL